MLPNHISGGSHASAHVPKSVFGVLTNWVPEGVPAASLVDGSYETRGGACAETERTVRRADQPTGAIQPAPHAATGK